MEISFYKANKEQTGGAIKLNLHKSGKFSFLKAAKQIAPAENAKKGEKVFSWEDDKSINVKLELVDIGMLLAVIHNRVEQTKIYHETELDNKIIEVTRSQRGYGFRISHKVKGNAETNSIFIGISHSEIEIMKLYLEEVGRINLKTNIYTPNIEQ